MLHDLFQNLDLTQVLIFLVTTVGGALIVWYRKRLKAWKKFWHGVLEGLRSIPELKADVKGIRYYVAPNGGGSLMDSVSRTEAAVKAITAQLELVVQTGLAENDTDEDVGRFHCDEAGANTYVNQLYARWLGVGKNELLKWNYLNFVHPDDVDKLRNKWEQCRAERRQFKCDIRMVSAHGAVIPMQAMATPIPETGEVSRWIGAMRRLDSARNKPDSP